MSDARSKVAPVLAVVGALALAALVYWILQSCGDDAPLSEVGLCTNGIDDDEDGNTDCDDIDCYLDDPACTPTRAGSDVGSRSDGDGGGDGDGDGDGDTDADTDANADRGRAAPDAEVCDPDGGACDWSCTSDDECVLINDMWECCGGFPHTPAASAELVSCVTATHRNRVAVDRCAVRWSPRTTLPSVPYGCRPNCDSMSCPQCPEVTERMRAVCRDGVCRALCEGCCTNDRDCPRGTFCVDPTNEGLHRCLAGEHECTTGDDCFRISTYADCGGCNCGDATHDGFRDCVCYGCGERGGPPVGTCTQDGDCQAHEFCEDRRCSFMGDSACREAMGDCGRCGFCQRDPERYGQGHMRGTCVPIDFGDAGPPADSGCEDYHPPPVRQGMR